MANGRSAPVLVMEDVPQAVEQPAGRTLPDWIERQRLLAGTSDEAVTLPLRAAASLVRERADLLGAAGWATAATRLRQSSLDELVETLLPIARDLVSRGFLLVGADR